MYVCCTPGREEYLILEYVGDDVGRRSARYAAAQRWLTLSTIYQRYLELRNVCCTPGREEYLIPEYVGMTWEGAGPRR